MTPSNRCPPRDSLQELLGGHLPSARQDELTRHIETCAGCQRTLESLSPVSQSWEDVAAQLAKPMPQPEPALQKVICQAKGSADSENTEAFEKPAVKASAGGETQAEDRRAIHEEGITFLRPPTRSGSIGRLGHYEILEVLGKGGFGTVYKAFDDKLHRMVAIKVLAPAFAANGAARARFIREARTAAVVKNEHVVAIYGVDDEAQPPYLVMEIIDGIALQDKIDRKGPLSLKEILRIGLQAAEGLAAAHKQGLVHRDIKPANILLENGVERVKITDFGLARAVDDASVTQSGTVAGTPMYMSPEQAEGVPIDHRSDLFSLGSVLYTMSTGHAPFRASGTHAVLKRVIDASPRPIRESNDEIPDWLCDIIAKLHAKKPEDRFQTAKEVAEILGQHLAHLQQPGVVPKPAWKATAYSGKPEGLPEEEEATFPVQLKVRDVVDVSLGIPLVPLILLCYWALPGLLMYWLGTLVGLAWWSVPIGFVSGTAIFFFLFFFLGLQGAQRAVVSRRGIQLFRDAGPPTIIPWESVRRIEEATRWEVFWKVWIWPGFRPRGSIMGMSALHHFRIEWDAGCYYFAPTDPEAFRKAIAPYLAQVSTPAPSTAPPRRPMRWLRIVAVLGLVALLAWRFGPHLVLIARNQAVLMVEVDDPQAKVILTRGKAVHTKRGSGSIEVLPGNYEIEIRPGPSRAVDRLSYFQQTLLTGHYVPHHPPDLREVYLGRGDHLKLTVSFKDVGPVPFKDVGSGPADRSWTQLFNGKDLTGWKFHPDQRGGWEVKNGLLVGTAGLAPHHLFSEGEFENFHLRAVVKVNDGGNSGIFFRSNFSVDRNGKYPTGHEVQILHSYPREVRLTGSIITHGYPSSYTPASRFALKPDEWFTLEVIARGHHLLTRINGKIAAQRWDRDRPIRKGHLVLQAMNDDVVKKTTEVHFKTIEIKELVDPEEMGSTSLFNGKDLTGWKPHASKPNNWKVENNILVGRAPQSYLMRDGFANKSFHLRAETRINDGGYGAVVVGTGPDLRTDGSLFGIWASINSTNAHYKTGDLIAVYLNFTQHPAVRIPPPKPNEWFILEVIVESGRVTTKVNGQTASEVNVGGRMGGSDHIALCVGNEKSVIEFRKIEIKELPPSKP